MSWEKTKKGKGERYSLITKGGLVFRLRWFLFRSFIMS